MFSNIGWGEMLILVIAGLVILGPERLPGAIRWTSNALRQARDYVSGATTQLRQDFGAEFEDLRVPITELQKLRGMMATICPPGAAWATASATKALYRFTVSMPTRRN